MERLGGACRGLAFRGSRRAGRTTRRAGSPRPRPPAAGCLHLRPRPLAASTCASRALNPTFASRALASARPARPLAARPAAGTLRSPLAAGALDPALASARSLDSTGSSARPLHSAAGLCVRALDFSGGPPARPRRTSRRTAGSLHPAGGASRLGGRALRVSASATWAAHRGTAVLLTGRAGGAMAGGTTAAACSPATLLQLPPPPRGNQKA